MPHVEPPKGFLSVTEVNNLGLPKVNVSKQGKPYFFLEQWRGKVGNQQADKTSKESREIGTAVHKAIEDRFHGETEIDDPQVKRMVDNLWRDFVVPFDVRPIKLEQTYTSELFKLQGTADGEIDTNKWKNVTVDWKTSNQLDAKGGPLQLSMYDYMRGGDGKGVLVRIDKSYKITHVEWYDNLMQYNPIWLSVMKTARYIKFGELV